MSDCFHLTVPSRFTHNAAGIRTFVCSVILKGYSLIWADHALAIRSSGDRHLGFPTLAVVKNAAANIHVQALCGPVLRFLRSLRRRGIAGSLSAHRDQPVCLPQWLPAVGPASSTGLRWLPVHTTGASLPLLITATLEGVGGRTMLFFSRKYSETFGNVDIEIWISVLRPWPFWHERGAFTMEAESRPPLQVAGVLSSRLPCGRDYVPPPAGPLL